MNIREILLANRKIHETTGCWIWTGRLNAADYGVISLPNEDNSRHRDYLVHRIAWKEFTGQEPINLILHIPSCPFKQCFKLFHLYDGTYSDNIEDSKTTGDHANQYGKTNKMFCKNNHPLFGENLIITSEGRRRCRTCQTEYNKKNWKKYPSSYISHKDK